jgi:hypothetical protein
MKKQICVPLEPSSCGSSIMGYVTHPALRRNKYDKKWYVEFEGVVALTDCSRRIEWELKQHGREHQHYAFNVKKLDRAIDALIQLRYTMATNNDIIKDLEAVAEQRNKKIKPTKEDMEP